MPQPTQYDVHYDRPLTDISVAFLQDAKNFVSSKVFPMVPVMKQSDRYWVWDRNNFFLDSMQKRADGTESAGSGMELSTDSYFCDVWALHKDIGNQTRANEDPAVQLDRATTEYLTLQGMIRKERQWVTDFFTTGVWTTDVVGGTDFTVWSDASSDPEADIDEGKRAVLASTGYEPNTLVVSYPVHLKLKQHPLIKERTKYTASGAEAPTEAVIAEYFGVPRYFVSKSIYATNAEGAASDTYSFTHGNNALLCYVPPAASLMTPSPGYTFMWSGLLGGQAGTSISRFDMPHLKSERLEIEMAFDYKKVSADLGYFFSAAIA